MTIFRHLVAVLAAWISVEATKLGVELSPEDATALIVAGYAVAEKVLKPLFRKFGEV